MDNFRFRTFKKDDIPVMRKVFNKAFEDYIIPIQLNESAFNRKIIQKTNIIFKFSIGSYFNRQLVGFLFQTINQYQHKKTAYNGGTGVLPAYRGNELTSQMYHYIIPKLINEGVENCVLEVISNNKSAIRSYEKIGFKKSKFYHCLKLDAESNYIKNATRKNFRTELTQKPAWETYEKFCDYETSFLDNFNMLQKNIINETIIEAYDGDLLIGYVVYNQKMGRVSNIGVKKNYRGKGVGTFLIKQMHVNCRKKPIYILNVNERSYNLLNFFLRLGFKNDIDQFELKLKLAHQ